MPLVTTKDMFKKAYEGHYAVGAFNVNNMEIVQGIVDAAKEEESPLILQVSAGARKYAKHAYLLHLVQAALEDTDLPIALHLDHGADFEICKACVDGGFTSVMIDGSKYPFEENIELTKRVVDYAHSKGVVVEAELGKLAGVEDAVKVNTKDATYTDPDQAVEFVERTGVSSLAIAIGTAHGFYAGTPVLDKERVSDCKKVVSVPLVLHGASGLSEEDVVECVQRGMCKVNFATELRVAYTDAEKQLLKENPETFDPKKLGIAAMKAVKEQTILRMKMCGCTGKVQ